VIERAASAILGAAMFLLFAWFGRWILRDPRRAFEKFWPNDPYFPHKPWKFTLFKCVGYFALFVGVMNATAIVLIGFLPHRIAENPLAFLLVCWRPS
jgi:hypothetical protein